LGSDFALRRAYPLGGQCPPDWPCSPSPSSRLIAIPFTPLGQLVALLFATLDLAFCAYRFRRPELVLLAVGLFILPLPACAVALAR